MTTKPSEIFLVYVKNDAGIAMPIFIRRDDRVDAIWDEVATSRKLNQGIIRGKALVHNGKRLLVTDHIRDVGIQPFDYIYLQLVAPIDLHQFSVPYLHHEGTMHTSPSGFNECP